MDLTMVRQTTPQKVYEDTEELLERGAEFRDWQSGRLVANITSLSAGLKYWLHESFNKVCSKGAIVAGHLDSAIESCWKQISKAGSYFQQLYEYSDGLLPSHFDAFERKVAWVLLIVLFVAIVCVMAAACRRYSPRWRHKTIEGEPLDSPIGSSPSFSDNQQTDASRTDPSLLKKHSSFESYSITSPINGRRITYPAIRTFFHPHPQAAKLPVEPTPLPLLVFIHGLGGSVAQFHPLLTSLVNVAPCLAIDLPGCGCSSFELTDWEAYKLENLAALIATAIEEHRDEEFGQEVMIIGHSMGCSLAVMLASARSPLMSKHILGVIAICPRGEIPSIKEVTKFKRLLSIPGPIFDLFRWWDQRGGTGSASVARFVGPGAEEETKKLQVLFNKQSRTPVWRRMAHGMLPTFSESGVPKGGLPGQEAWAGLEVPVMLIAGEADKVTPAMEVEKIAAFLGKTSRKQPGEGMEDGEAIVDAAAPVDSGLADGSSDGKLTKNQKKKRRRRKQNNSDTKRNDSGAPSTSSILAIKDDFVEDRPAQNKDAKHKAVLKTTILPSPAAHSLLYAPSTARIIAGLIQLFLASHIDPRLSQGWQLQYLHTEGKWDVKNLVKWQGVQAVSLPIPGPSEKKYKLPNGAEATQQSPIRKYQGPVFRAMKTLREVDDTHSPSIFVKQWRGKIRAVVDISHESPVYDPQGLEKGGIEYHKFPTVSKLPPTIEEVKGFIDLIDRLRAQLGVGGSLPFTTEPRATPTDAEEQDASEDFDEAPVIGVHCHYGFNRTGFFVVCYLIDKLGFRLQDAIDEFERQRPPGIRHRHFVDQLFVRYCVGLKRAPTL